MSAFLSVRVHFIWSTHNRLAQILSQWRDDLYGYLHGIAENHRCTLLVAGGVADHIHLYVSLPATISLADFVNAMKANSSRWVHQNHDPLFAWQTKYAAFSVSRSAEDALCNYIRNQEAHHQHKSFREELLEFLQRHEIDYNPAYFLE
jgi:REP element-mobilizing transposase RayT